MKKCPQCGFENQPHNQFCKQCGAKLTADDAGSRKGEE